MTDSSIISDPPQVSVDNKRPLEKELYKMMSEYKEEFQQSKFYYVLKEFEGNSGFGLYSKLTEKDSKYFERILSLNYLH